MKKLFAILAMMGIMNATAMAQNYQKNEIALTWGIGSAQMIGQGFASISHSIEGDASNKLQTGNISLQYMRNLNKTIAVGAIVGYENLSSEIKDNGQVHNCSENDITIMPAIRASWYRTNLLSIYSKVAAGVDFAVSSDSNDKSETMFAFQVTPIGIEIGKGNIRGMVEAGFGFQGMVMAGIRYGF